MIVGKIGELSHSVGKMREDVWLLLSMAFGGLIGFVLFAFLR